MHRPVKLPYVETKRAPSLENKQDENSCKLC